VPLQLPLSVPVPVSAVPESVAPMVQFLCALAQQAQ
jgi:hypothetical protein